MVEAIAKARYMARKAHEAMYEGICTVIGYEDVETEYGETRNIATVLLENQICHLSHKNISPSEQTDGTNNATSLEMLFIAPEVNIKPGCKITVTQSGATADYVQTGLPAIYATHQEIMLKRVEKA